MFHDNFISLTSESLQILTLFVKNYVELVYKL
jgi:hypothetical protein